MPQKKIKPAPVNFTRAKSVLDSWIEKKDAMASDMSSKKSNFDKRAIEIGFNLLALRSGINTRSVSTKKKVSPRTA